MRVVKKIFCLITLLYLASFAYCQSEISTKPGFSLIVLDENSQPANGATVELLKDQKLVKAAITDAKGIARFEKIADGTYTFAVSFAGYKPQSSGEYHFPSDADSSKMMLQPIKATLQEVNITAQKPFIEQRQGKVILNVGSSVTNVGTTVLEVLEKSPGVTVDRSGGIALKGKAGVLILIDDKPTYLSAADLNNLLSSMSSAQVDQIELMTNPPAKYDASGNAGIINIKTKKNRSKGFNGAFTTTFGQGVYPKHSDNLVLNYRTGKFNAFLNYNVNVVKYLTDLYALRKYYDGSSVPVSMLKQPSYFSGTFINNTVKTGLDYFVNPKTTIGIVLGATAIQRQGNNNGKAIWLDQSGVTDSTILTTSKTDSRFKNGSVNINARHEISASQDISFNADLLRYTIQSKQNFDNIFLAPGGYDEASRGDIPTAITISSGKLDYSLKIGKNSTLQSGWKSSHSSTDNTAFYQNLTNGQWVVDNTKSNHFIYHENIHALYSDVETKYKQFSMQAGVRYEYTGYNADQLGNAIQKDSAFSRKYGGLFPSGYISYQADSSNNFTFTAGRRIDRPAYQSLNPFYFIVNKYTYETGNPYLLPQYSWNLEISHQYKDLLTTTASYSIITNYFSQLFLADTTKGILLYSQGNVGHTYNVGLSTTLMLSPLKWWSLTAQAVYNHKQLIGFNGNNYKSSIDQLNISTTQLFTIAQQYTAEMTGSYTTRARNDVQELLYPTGQLSFGLSKPVLKKKGTLKLSARDVFYTNAMEGLTQFPGATEYFKLRRDTRVVMLSFTYRFGKAYKTGKRSEGSAADEIDRVGNG